MVGRASLVVGIDVGRYGASAPPFQPRKRVLQLRFPCRSDFTSLPTSTMPHSSLASMKYSCSARRLLIRGERLCFSFPDIAGDAMRQEACGKAGREFRIPEWRIPIKFE